MPANVVLIMTDQHHARCLGCAGESVLKTPSIDRLAEEGVHFTSAYAQSAHCGPSRVSFLTGMYEHTHLRHRNDEEPPMELSSLPVQLREHGYQTTLIGKGHVGVEWPREHFDDCRFSFMTDALPGDPLSVAYFKYLVDNGVADRFDQAGKYYHLDPDKPLPISELPLEHSLENWTGDETVRYLRQRDMAKPFFAFVSFDRPHEPLILQAELAGMYDPDEIQLPANVDDTFETKSDLQKAAGRGELGYPYHPSTQAGLRRVLARYYAIITHIDEQVGKIYAELEAQGILDDTIILFTADHGNFAGEHGLFAKNLGFYECIHGIPYLMRYPRGLPTGARFDGIVESVDMYPTLAELLGIEAPITVQGRSFARALRGEGKWTKSASLCEHVTADYHYMSMRTRDFRITVDAAGDASELYDHRCDPGELVNLWDHGDYSQIRARLVLDMLRYRACPDLLFDPPTDDWIPDRVPDLPMPDRGEDVMDLYRGTRLWSQLRT